MLRFVARVWFEHAADALVNFLPPGLRTHSAYVSARNLKVWFGEGREHYEIQYVGKRHLRGRALRGRYDTVLEIGFHAEHPDARANEDALARVRAGRRALGRAPEAGPFLGRKEWRRLSEVWDGDEIYGIDAATEAAARLADYIRALEPLRARASSPAPTATATPRSRTPRARRGSAPRSAGRT